MQIPIVKDLAFHEVVDRSDGVQILDTIFGCHTTLPPNRQSTRGTAQISHGGRLESSGMARAKRLSYDVTGVGRPERPVG